MPKQVDLTNHRFGKLTAIRTVGVSKNNGYFWNCICDCGNTTKVTVGNLNSGHTKSCGCINKLSPPRATHNMSKTKEYKSWVKMRERCLDTNCADYASYGAMNIKIQDSWIDSFDNFISYLGKFPKTFDRYSIDRIDNTKGYEEGNVRWATYTQQARNKGSFKNNTSNVNGVLWDNKKHPTCEKWSLYAKAVWNTLDTGKQCTKVFSVKTYGLMPAFLMACNYRIKMIEDLNSKGAGYSVSHGL
jgi:hypothetical protein